MRGPYTQLYLHLVWSTWDREPVLVGEVRQLVYRAIHSKCKALGAELICIGGTCDHVHLLLRLPTTLAVATLVQHIKGSSSHLVTHQQSQPAWLKWQGAYGAFTVSKSAVPSVREYIENQETHHRDATTMRDLEFAWSELPPLPNEQS